MRENSLLKNTIQREASTSTPGINDYVNSDLDQPCQILITNQSNTPSNCEWIKQLDLTSSNNGMDDNQ